MQPWAEKRASISSSLWPTSTSTMWSPHPGPSMWGRVLLSPDLCDPDPSIHPKHWWAHPGHQTQASCQQTIILRGSLVPLNECVFFVYFSIRPNWTSYLVRKLTGWHVTWTHAQHQAGRYFQPTQTSEIVLLCGVYKKISNNRVDWSTLWPTSTLKGERSFSSDSNMTWKVKAWKARQYFSLRIQHQSALSPLLFRADNRAVLPVCD